MKKEVKKKIIVSAGKTNETTIIYNSSRSAKGEKIRYFLEKLARSMGLLILNLEIMLINSPPPPSPICKRRDCDDSFSILKLKYFDFQFYIHIPTIKLI